LSTPYLAAVDVGGAVTDGFRTFATFIPKLIGFLLILIIGYFIAKVISKVVDKLLQKAGFDRAVERGGIKKALAKSNYDASDIVAKIVFFAIFIPVLSAAIGQLGIAALQAPLAAFITLIPKILVAIVLVVIGAAIAGALKKLITDALGGLSYGSALGNGQKVIRAAAAALKAAGAHKVEVIGYTDVVAGQPVNKALSAKRARAVAAALRTELGSGDTVTSSGRGEQDPAASNGTRKGRQQNRRAAILDRG